MQTQLATTEVRRVEQVTQPVRVSLAGESVDCSIDMAASLDPVRRSSLLGLVVLVSVVARALRAEANSWTTGDIHTVTHLRPGFPYLPPVARLPLAVASRFTTPDLDF